MNDAPMLRALWTAIGLIAVLAGAAWWVRRRAPGWAGFSLRRPAADQALRRIAKLALTPQHSLHVVEWNGHQWLIGTGTQGLTLQSIPVPGSFPLELNHKLLRPDERPGESAS